MDDTQKANTDLNNFLSLPGERLKQLYDEYIDANNSKMQYVRWFRRIVAAKKDVLRETLAGER